MWRIDDNDMPAVRSASQFGNPFRDELGKFAPKGGGGGGAPGGGGSGGTESAGAGGGGEIGDVAKAEAIVGKYERKLAYVEGQAEKYGMDRFEPDIAGARSAIIGAKSVVKAENKAEAQKKVDKYYRDEKMAEGSNGSPRLSSVSYAAAKGASDGAYDAFSERFGEAPA